jgi:hypothetical protein
MHSNPGGQFEDSSLSCTGAPIMEIIQIEDIIWDLSTVRITSVGQVRSKQKDQTKTLTKKSHTGGWRLAEHTSDGRFNLATIKGKTH